jgi:two-component system, OmpR family, phosphate regulon response regulator PhoB
MLPQSKSVYLASPRLGLVADPDAGNRDQCRSILRPIVPDIVYAEDGREALALAISHRPRFVITATELRFIDGYTLCSLLRAEPVTADVPIVVLTCDTTPASIMLARSSGADRVVGTPYSPGTLLQAVGRGRDRAWTAGESAHSIPPGSAASHLGLVGSVEAPAARRSRFMVGAHRRFETRTPPIVPPPLVCPTCDRPLQYVRSHVGGVSARLSEQWDYYRCHGACGTFQYRQRTRRLRRVA